MRTRPLALLLALALLSGCAPEGPEPSPAPALAEEALTGAFLTGGEEVGTVRVLAQADLGDQTVCACLLRPQDPAGPLATLRIAAVDRNTAAVTGPELTLRVPDGFSNPWVVMEPGDEGVTVQFLGYRWDGAESVNPIPEGGGVRWDGEAWTWLWPGAPGTEDYDAFWSTHDFQAFPGGQLPFRLWDTTVPSQVWGILERDLEQRVLPGCREQGVSVWGYLMEPIKLGELDIPAGAAYAGPPEVWRLTYRLMGPDFPRPDGPEDSQVLLLAPWADAAGETELRLLHRFEDGGDSDDAYLLRARELLRAQAPDGHWTAVGPNCPQGDRYDSATGLFYSDALDMGLLVPQVLRDSVAFRHETYGDGSVGLAVLIAPLAARFEEAGDGPDGVLGRVRAMDEAQFNAYRASLSPERFPFGVAVNCGTNISPSYVTYLQGRYFVSASNVHSWPLGELEEPALSALAWTAQDYAGELLASFYTGAWLPVDVDLSLARPRPGEEDVYDRVAVGVTGDLPLGTPLTVVESETYVFAEGDRWRKETWDGLTAVFYVDGETGTKTVTALSATGADWFTFRRGIGIGGPFPECWMCYGGQDYGYGLPQPQGQREGDDPFRFCLTQTEAGVPLPCTYWMEFQSDGVAGYDGQIVRITQYADLTDGRDPFA